MNNLESNYFKTCKKIEMLSYRLQILFLLQVEQLIKKEAKNKLNKLKNRLKRVVRVVKDKHKMH
jgi:hypothetical protein